jgi:proteasome beta subunit
MEKPEGYKGTTILGIVCKDGVILASEFRATLGYTIAGRDIKVYEIEPHIGFAGAGGAGDNQALSKILKVETKLFKTRNGRPITVEGGVNLLSSIMYQYKMYPFISFVILGGIEADGTPKLYSLDPYGSVMKDKYTASGSGMQMALGILDDRYEEGMLIKDAAPLAVKAVLAGIKRDAMSGDGVDIITITKGGFKRWDKAEVEKLIEKEKTKEKR